MARPLISVVICCHNRASWLPETLASVLRQTYEPMEILVLDDGSTDNTAEIVKPYLSRIRYHYQENAGVALARTTGGRIARGELIAFQDDDDLMAPDRLEVLYAALDAHPHCAFSVGDLEVIDPDERLADVVGRHSANLAAEYRVFDDGYDAVMWPRVPATNHTTLFRRADAERISWFDPDYNIGGEDKDFFARLGRLGPVVHVAHVVSYYRRGHDQMTSRQLVTEFAALRRFQHHLRLGQHELKQDMSMRLRQRILGKLKEMERIRTSLVDIPDLVDPQYVPNALAFLTGRQRLEYWWDAKVRVPIAGLVRRSRWLRDHR